MSKRRKPRRGDPVWVYWRDITTDPVGDPKDAKCWRARTICIFNRWKKNGDLVVSGTQGLDDDDLYGWDIFPSGAIAKVRRVK